VAKRDPAIRATNQTAIDNVDRISVEHLPDGSALGWSQIDGAMQAGIKMAAHLDRLVRKHGKAA
jgi:hypothetical protein